MSFIEEQMKKLKQKSLELDQYEKGLQPPTEKQEQVQHSSDSTRFNVHKRSLPVGIDEVVLVNVTKEEFEQIKRHSKRKFETTVMDDETLIYYDWIPVNANEKEKSIFFNTRPIIIEEK